MTTFLIALAVVVAFVILALEVVRVWQSARIVTADSDEPEALVDASGVLEHTPDGPRARLTLRTSTRRLVLRLDATETYALSNRFLHTAAHLERAARDLTPTAGATFP